MATRIVDKNGRELLIGSATSANSIPVVIASDQAAVPTTPTGNVAAAGANTEGTALASAVRAASTSSSDLTNYNARGVMLFVNITANPGGGETLTPKIEAKDPISGTYARLGAAFTAINAGGGNAMYTYVFFPAVTAGQDGNNNAVLPKTWRVTVTHSASGNWTYSVGYCTLVA